MSAAPYEKLFPMLTPRLESARERAKSREQEQKRLICAAGTKKGLGMATPSQSRKCLPYFTPFLRSKGTERLCGVKRVEVIFPHSHIRTARSLSFTAGLRQAAPFFAKILLLTIIRIQCRLYLFHSLSYHRRRESTRIERVRPTSQLSCPSPLHSHQGIWRGQWPSENSINERSFLHSTLLAFSQRERVCEMERAAISYILQLHQCSYTRVSCEIASPSNLSHFLSSSYFLFTLRWSDRCDCRGCICAKRPRFISTLSICHAISPPPLVIAQFNPTMTTKKKKKKGTTRTKAAREWAKSREC